MLDFVPDFTREAEFCQLEFCRRRSCMHDAANPIHSLCPTFGFSFLPHLVSISSRVIVLLTATLPAKLLAAQFLLLHLCLLFR